MSKEKWVGLLKRQPEIALWIWGGCLCAMLFTGIKYAWLQSFLAGAESTTGTVVDRWTTTSTDSKGKSSSTGHIKYQFIVGGKEFSFTEKSDFVPYQKGDTATVYYDPEDPSSASDGIATGTLIVFFLGLGISVVTLVVSFFYRYKRPQYSSR